MALLQIERLSVAIAAGTILENLSLAMEAGEILGIVGESGSGKSTLALAIMRLLPPAARLTGAIRFGTASLDSISEAAMNAVRGHRIGLVFQEPLTALNPLLCIGDQVAEALRAHRRLPRLEAARLARAGLERVGLPAAEVDLQRYPHELSGGQRQRVAIAIAVASRPKLLIADEPTTALDVTTQAQILDLLQSLVREDQMALMLISHDLPLIARTAHRIAIMRAGRILEQGATANVLRSSREPYTRALVEAATLLSSTDVPAREPTEERSRLTSVSASTGPVFTCAPALELREVICDYAAPRSAIFAPARAFRAVDGVSLAVARGERVGLIGESGSGKTTLLRAILAVGPIRSGEVRLVGESLTTARGERLRRLRRSIQCVFQDPAGSFDPHWRVERLIGEPLHLLDTVPTGRERALAVAAMLERVGLPASLTARRAHELSGGERQRVAIARALILEPAIVALDEATSALDASTRLQILELLAELSDRLGIAYLFISHDLGLVRRLTDRVVILRRGRIVESGATPQVFDAPRDPYTAALIAASPRLA